MKQETTCTICHKTYEVEVMVEPCPHCGASFSTQIFVNEEESEQIEPCPGFDHDWKEEYYGHRCTRCDTFYAHGQAPWDWNEDEEYDDDDIYDY